MTQLEHQVPSHWSVGLLYGTYRPVNKAEKCEYVKQHYVEVADLPNYHIPDKIVQGKSDSNDYHKSVKGVKHLQSNVLAFA